VDLHFVTSKSQESEMVFRKPKGLNFLGGLKRSHMFLKLLSVSGGQHSSDNIEVDKVG
jgi:hypothetical protein